MSQFNCVSLPSTYRGVTFRSRLEARVAVFLHLIGARYEFEYEGFNLNGKCYLPDFWLPDVRQRFGPQKGVWLEVKPNTESCDGYGETLKALSTATGHPAYLFTGSLYDLDWFSDEGRGDGMYEHDALGWDNCMGFQSSFAEVRVQFREGNYEWGDPAVTELALNTARNWRFA